MIDTLIKKLIYFSVDISYFCVIYDVKGVAENLFI